MKGDFTRSTFRRRNHYSSVRMQQGRVQLDADWNEQVDLTRDRIETEAADLIGGCGAPLHADGFRPVETAADLTAEEAARPGNASPPGLMGDGDFLLTVGRMYVDGVLAENDAITRYRAQPHLPDPGPVAEGTYLAYLDVWERHLTALEAPGIREVALGGPDTATRLQTTWQVKLLSVTDELGDGEAASCLMASAAWDALTAPPSGQMAAQAETTTPSDDPCIVTPGAGYRALENRLYRVEVHGGGDRATASFKWSRDNGTVVSRWMGETPVDATEMRVAVSSLGRDSVLRFLPGKWVELTDDSHELEGRPGTLVQVLRAEDDTLTLDLTTAIGTELALADYPDNPRIRRWDGVVQGVTNTNWRSLEDGVQVRFFAGTYRTGDYWLVPARTATADVEWPADGAGNALQQPPAGVRHHYCRLGVLTFSGGTWTGVTDCRPLFPPVTELTSLFYVSGDGQEATPNPAGGGVALDHPIQVGVANGRWPVAGARVRFRVAQGGGNVNGSPDAVVVTGADGVAGVGWTLGAVGQPQQVEATLLDAAGQPMHLPIRFTARYREGGADEEPGFHVLRIQAGGAPLVNDAEVSVERLARGIEVTCDVPFISEAAFGPRKPVCFVTLYLPWPFPPDDRQFWLTESPVATHPIRLNATAAADDDSIFWNAQTNTQSWLRQGLFTMLEELGYLEPILGYLTLKGNFIWERSADGEQGRTYLDGDVFGVPRADGGTDARLPSGDRRRGGDLEVWFHLVRSEGNPDLRVEPGALSFGTVTVGGAADETFVISNVGTGPLVVSGLRVDAPGFQALESVPFSVEPGSQRAVVVRFAPTQAGRATARLTVDSNDPDAQEQDRTVALFGDAVPETRPRNRARVQVLHNATAAAVSVQFNDVTLVENLALGSGTPFMDVPSGRRTVVRAIAADTGAEVASVETVFLNQEAYTLVLCGDAQGVTFSILENAREAAADGANVDVRPYNGARGAQTTVALREANASVALQRCAGANGYSTVAPRGLNVVAIDSNGQQSGVFDFDLTAQSGQAFTILLFGFPVSDRVQVIAYGIDGEGRRILPRQLQEGGGGRVVQPVSGFRGGRVVEASRSEVTAVRGVGTAFAERLAESGIRNAGQLAALDAERLGALIGISTDRADAIVREARVVVSRREP